MDMEEMMGGMESGAPMGKSEKVARINALMGEAKALADECGYDIGSAIKDLKMNASMPDNSDDMEEAGEAYEAGDDSPEHGDDMEAKKALAISVLKKKKAMME